MVDMNDTTADINTAARAFDFLDGGTWTVHHHKLKQRLANCDEWWDFDGTCSFWKILGGVGNVDDNVFDHPDGMSHGATVRLFDTATGLWSIWWMNAGVAAIDTPVVGRFTDGVGTFEADEVFEGRPIRVRFTWSDITPTSAKWQQAFSPDGGATWEINWSMEFERA